MKIALASGLDNFGDGSSVTAAAVSFGGSCIGKG